MMPGLSGKSGQLCEFSGRWLCLCERKSATMLESPTGSTVPVSDSEVDSQAEGAVLMALLNSHFLGVIMLFLTKR